MKLIMTQVNKITKYKNYIAKLFIQIKKYLNINVINITNGFKF